MSSAIDTQQHGMVLIRSSGYSLQEVKSNGHD